ncbi:MAG TPA: hypothetical protein VJG30_04005 [Candidatus Nanoarchaeia archaeon]|nr:hypothetical protein [Candidatus Nanoarchaeia archaeon]
MTHKIHGRKRRYLARGPERNRKARPKTFKSEAEARKYAEKHVIKEYLIERMNYGLSKKFRIVKK